MPGKLTIVCETPMPDVDGGAMTDGR